MLLDDTAYWPLPVINLLLLLVTLVIFPAVRKMSCSYLIKFKLCLFACFTRVCVFLLSFFCRCESNTCLVTVLCLSAGVSTTLVLSSFFLFFFVAVYSCEWHLSCKSSFCRCQYNTVLSLFCCCVQLWVAPVLSVFFLQVWVWHLPCHCFVCTGVSITPILSLFVSVQVWV